jgi:hypothetical protein
MLSLSRRGEEDDRELWVADANGDNPVPSPAKSPEYTIAQGAFDWTPDGKRVLISSRSSDRANPICMR